MLDGLRGYLQIASGLTDVTRQRAQAVATSLTSSGETLTALVTHDVRGQVGGLAEEILATSKANRELLLSLVRSEVERQVARLGLVPSSELEAATARADRLEARLRKLETQVDRRGVGFAAEGASTPSGGGTSAPAGHPGGDTPPVATKKTVVKKAGVNEAGVKKAAVKKAASSEGQIPAAKAGEKAAGVHGPGKDAGPTAAKTRPGAPTPAPPAVGPDGGVL